MGAGRLWWFLVLFLVWCSVGVSGNYTSSIHADPTLGVKRSTAPTYVSRGNCYHCHEAHGAAKSNLLFEFQETVCYYCHSIPSQNDPALSYDIKAQFGKPYHHPVEWNSSHFLAHKETSSDLQPPHRHAECADCHNPHIVKGEVHTSGSPPQGGVSPSENNRVSGALLGVFGVEPQSWNSNWGPSPTSFLELRSTVSDPSYGAQKEYQICLKCHSYYGFGASLDTNTGIVTITWNSTSTFLTDQAREFSPNNYSVHPVVEPLSTRAGGYTPKSLGNNRMKPPWDQYSGQQTMYCSDCHGEDARPRGPHGTDSEHILTSGYTWPKKPASCGGGYWTLWDVLNNKCSWDSTLLCAKCHKMCGDGITCDGNFYNEVHDKGDHNNEVYTINGNTYNGAPCVACHIAVPHGSHASRLIVYVSDPAPYDAEDAMAQIEGFCKASDPFGYSKFYCYSTTPACDYHNKNRPGSCSEGSYDP